MRVDISSHRSLYRFTKLLFLRLSYRNVSLDSWPAYEDGDNSESTQKVEW